MLTVNGWMMVVAQIPYDDHHMEYRDHKVFVYELHRIVEGRPAPGSAARTGSGNSRPIV